MAVCKVADSHINADNTQRLASGGSASSASILAVIKLESTLNSMLDLTKTAWLRS